MQPLEAASFDAWIKLYRPDENTPNTAISYYTKGAVVGFLLDAKIRSATGGAKSLDDVMRLAYTAILGRTRVHARGVPRRGARGRRASISAWFTKVLETTEELEYAEALDWFGLRFGKPEPAKDGTPPKAWLGLGPKAEDGRLMVTQVKRGATRVRGGLQRRRRDPGHRRLSRAARPVVERMEQFRPGRDVSGAGLPPRAADAARRHLRRRTDRTLESRA